MGKNYIALAIPAFLTLIALELAVLRRRGLHGHRLNDALNQFWLHTRTIRTLGPLEWGLMTPSHHRVHHGRNPKERP